MFNFSTKTVVDRKFKLSDLFAQIGASKEVKKDAACIEKVVLTNVLSPTTLNCDPDKTVKEVYIIEITVKDRYVPELFIKELDKHIKFHTLFNVRHGEWELSMISFKLGTSKGKYYQTNWENEDDMDVPPVNSVPELYKFMLSKFWKYPPFESESVEEYVKRYGQLVKLDFQINATQNAMNRESQSKKKFEYNARLKRYKEEREKLLGGEK